MQHISDRAGCGHSPDHFEATYTGQEVGQEPLILRFLLGKENRSLAELGWLLSDFEFV